MKNLIIFLLLIFSLILPFLISASTFIVSPDKITILQLQKGGNIFFIGCSSFGFDMFFNGEYITSISPGCNTDAISNNLINYLFIPKGAGVWTFLDMEFFNWSNSLEIYSAMFTVPTSTVTDLLANVTAQIGDTGTLLVIVLAAGIPLFFYVVKRIIRLIPKSK